MPCTLCTAHVSHNKPLVPGATPYALDLEHNVRANKLFADKSIAACIGVQAVVGVATHRDKN